jgi:LmbE family N-acetylglucosaminyl deacetylase
VVVVVATDGDLGLASEAYAADGHLGKRRLAELRESAAVLGVARVEHLGYADSGLDDGDHPDPPGRVRFVRAPLEEAAQRLATILREEQVDVLLTYDRNGGYGHRDHVRVHQVGNRAAELAGTPKVLQATVPRDTIARAVDLAARVYRFPPEFDRAAFTRAFSARAEITHRISVWRYAAAKRASMRAHASQATADGGADRTLAAFLRIPRPLYDVVFGREWFVDAARPAGRPVARDVFEGLP